MMRVTMRMMWERRMTMVGQSCRVRRHWRRHRRQGRTATRSDTWRATHGAGTGHAHPCPAHCYHQLLMMRNVTGRVDAANNEPRAQTDCQRAGTVAECQAGERGSRGRDEASERRMRAKQGPAAEQPSLDATGLEKCMSTFNVQTQRKPYLLIKNLVKLANQARRRRLRREESAGRV